MVARIAVTCSGTSEKRRIGVTRSMITPITTCTLRVQRSGRDRSDPIASASAENIRYASNINTINRRMRASGSVNPGSRAIICKRTYSNPAMHTTCPIATPALTASGWGKDRWPSPR